MGAMSMFVPTLRLAKIASTKARGRSSDRQEHSGSARMGTRPLREEPEELARVDDQGGRDAFDLGPAVVDRLGQRDGPATALGVGIFQGGDEEARAGKARDGPRGQVGLRLGRG